MDYDNFKSSNDINAMKKLIHQLWKKLMNIDRSNMLAHKMSRSADMHTSDLFKRIKAKQKAYDKRYIRKQDALDRLKHVASNIQRNINDITLDTRNIEGRTNREYHLKPNDLYVVKHHQYQRDIKNHKNTKMVKKVRRILKHMRLNYGFQEQSHDNHNGPNIKHIRPKHPHHGPGF